MPAVANIFGRNEFLFRRWHSLTGLVPVGAFLGLHLATNAAILDGPATYQRRVNQIHDLGPVTLFWVEWLLILVPILFHGTIGMIIVLRGKRNVWLYPYRENIRYTLQRWTGVIALVFILWHVFQTRGWLPGQWWIEHVTRPLGGGTFDAQQAAATAAQAIQASVLVRAAYLVGILAAVYHLANGLWTMGITWGVWTSPEAQQRANWPCLLVGLMLAAMGLGALVGMQLAPLE